MFYYHLLNNQELQLIDSIRKIRILKPFNDSSLFPPIPKLHLLKMGCGWKELEYLFQYLLFSFVKHLLIYLGFIRKFLSNKVLN